MGNNMLKRKKLKKKIRKRRRESLVAGQLTLCQGKTKAKKGRKKKRKNILERETRERKFVFPPFSIFSLLFLLNNLSHKWSQTRFYFEIILQHCSQEKKNSLLLINKTFFFFLCDFKFLLQSLLYLHFFFPINNNNNNYILFYFCNLLEFIINFAHFGYYHYSSFHHLHFLLQLFQKYSLCLFERDVTNWCFYFCNKKAEIDFIALDALFVPYFLVSFSLYIFPSFGFLFFVSWKGSIGVIGEIIFM